MNKDFNDILPQKKKQSERTDNARYKVFHYLCLREDRMPQAACTWQNRG